MPDHELSFDELPDACESPLLDPGSDGIVYGSGDQVLDRLVDYQEAGHSLGRVRRDFALDTWSVSNGDIERATEKARAIRENRAGRPYSPKKYFGGVSLPKAQG